jgi:hypothetical protein
MVVVWRLLLLLLILMPLPAQADFLRLVAAKGEAKGRAKVLVWRQQLDFSSGFDSYFFDLFEAPANKRLSSHPVAQKTRKKWLPLGQFEVYLQELAKAGEKLLQEYGKKGFEAVCDRAWYAAGKGDHLTFSTGKQDVTLRIVRGQRRDEIFLEKDPDHRYSLVRILPPGGRNAPTVGGRAFVQAALLKGGRMLAVVVRTHTLPLPENTPADTLYFFPLRRATKQLNLPYPFAVEDCLKQDHPWP